MRTALLAALCLSLAAPAAMAQDNPIQALRGQAPEPVFVEDEVLQAIIAADSRPAADRARDAGFS